MKKIHKIFSIMFLLFTTSVLTSCQAKVSAGETNKIENLDVNKFAEIITKGNGVILDVMTMQEYSGGNVEGAVNIDFYGNQFENQLKKLDPEKEYYVYCASGNRSGKAAKVMAKNGFKKVYNLSNAGYSELKKKLK